MDSEGPTNSSEGLGEVREKVAAAVGMGTTRYFEAEAVVQATEEPHIRAWSANMATTGRWGASQVFRLYLLAAQGDRATVAAADMDLAPRRRQGVRRGGRPAALGE